MNILHVAPLSQYEASGFVFSILGLAKAQADLGHRVGLICSTPPGLKKEEVPGNIVLIPGPVKRHLNPWRISYKWIEKIDKLFVMPDIVNFHGTYIPFQIALGKRLHKEGIPYVLTPRGDLKKIAQNIKPLKKKLGNSLFVRKFIKKAMSIHALTNAEETEMRQFNPDSEIIVVPNGIDDEILKFDSLLFPDEKIIDKNMFIIGFIGRIDVHIKGLDLLLTAVKKMQDVGCGNKIKLVLTGPFYTRQDDLIINRFLAQMKIPENVILTGPLFGQDKWKVLMAFDIFACTSRSEGMPMAVLEAMAFRKPCLITPGSNAHDYVISSGSGWICEETPDSIAETICMIMENKKDICKMGERAREYVKNNLLWSSVAAQDIQKKLNLLSV